MKEMYVLQLVGWVIITLVMAAFRMLPGGMMAQSYYGPDVGVNVTLLSKVMQLQVWRDLGHWAQMVGFIKKTQNVEVGVPGNAMLPRPTGKAIEVYREFVSEGREEILVPMKRVLTAAPTGGDEQLEGNEERYKKNYKTVHINALGHAVSVITGPMGKQRFKMFAKEMFKSGSKDLTDYFSRLLASYGIQSAIFEGRSHNLTAGIDGWVGMKSLRRISHPNFYVAGNGPVAWNGVTYSAFPGTANYETAVEAALNGLVAGANTKFSTKIIKMMKSEAIACRRIPQTIPKEGISFYPIVAHTSQVAQLKEDTDWKEEVKHSLPRGWEHPIFTGAVGYYDGCVIYEMPDMFGVQVDGNGAVVTDANGCVRYGPALTKASENIFTVHNSDLKLAVLYGPSFMGVGIGQDLRMQDEVKDYGRKTNAGADMVYGFELASYFDNDNDLGNGAGKFAENTSSLLCATFSPHTLSWD